MRRYTKIQRIEIIKSYYENKKSIRSTFRALRETFGRHNRPTELGIRKLIQKFESTGSVADAIQPHGKESIKMTKNIESVKRSVMENPSTSVRRRSQELGLSYGTTWNILRHSLQLKAYKIQLTQELQPNDHQLRRDLADWAIKQIEVDPDFHRKIIFSDEAHFWLNGYVNKQNCRYWSEDNQYVITEKSYYPQKVTVWCAFWSEGIIGPYFFENECGKAVTVNGERYRNMIKEYFWHQIDDLELKDMWFQQDGATCHTSSVTIDLLREKFDDRVISRNAGVRWPPRSCDITPLDFFLWGYVKSIVYCNKPTTINDLKDNIRRAITDITADLCEKVAQNWSSRVFFLKKSRGGHLKDIIFK